MPDRTLVTLPGPGTKDWLVAGIGSGPGAASGAQTVRDTDGQQWLSGPHVTGNPISSVGPGPFSVRWKGGQPSTGSSTSSSWLAVRSGPGGPASGLTVTAPASAPGDELVLYAGVDGADGELEVLAAGGTVRRMALPGRTTPVGYLITVRFDGMANPGQDVGVRLMAGDGGSVGVAAAALR